MTIKLYELEGAEGRHYSQFSWRSRLALAHKQLDAEFVPVRLSDKPAIAFSGGETVPVLVDGEAVVRDSWAIACHLEDAHGAAPSLFGGAGGRGLSRFINSWVDRVVVPALFPMIAADIHQRVHDDDREYFRSSMERILRRPLEAAQEDRDQAVVRFRRLLDPARQTLKSQPFLGGLSAFYADYILFSTLQWARVMSPFGVLEDDDPVAAWRAQILELFGGLAAAEPAASVT